jgi:YesN/AraC family two-component response regulator
MSFHHLQIVIYEILLTYQIYYPDFLEIDSNIYQYTEDLLEEFYLLEDLQTTLVSHGIACLSGFNALPSDLIVSQKIIQYIQDHYKEADLSVSKIARAFGFNTSYLGTLFKKTTNQSILHYISSLRLEASKELLLSQQHKVSEIAELVGYSDVFYYSKRFKKAYGCSPKEYVMTLRE